MSVNPRLNRLFNPNGNCVQVALDHGIANVAAFLSGIEDMKKVIGLLVEGNPDGILVTPGQAHWLQDLTQKPKPALGFIIAGSRSDSYAKQRSLSHDRTLM